MALFGMAVTVVLLLAKKYPEGYTLEELQVEAAAMNRWILDVDVLKMVLGPEDNHPTEYSSAACWRMDGEMIFFDTEALFYSDFDKLGFKDAVESWFRQQKLDHLVLKNKGEQLDHLL